MAKIGDDQAPQILKISGKPDIDGHLSAGCSIVSLISPEPSVASPQHTHVPQILLSKYDKQDIALPSNIQKKAKGVPFLDISLISNSTT